MMKKTFSGRRVPRQIGQEEEELVDAQTSSDTSHASIVRRPKPRKSSSLRQSLGPSTVDEEDSDGAVVTPKRQNISRVAIQRNASKRSSLLASQLPVREFDDENDRPSYTAASLQELKASTPSTPQQFNSVGNSNAEDILSENRALDLSSKFGTSLSRYEQSSAIPSAGEIAEKKARRARLAKEQRADEFISLDPDDPDLDEDDSVMKDESGRLVLKPKDKYAQSESRLVADDEDIMENFDEFTEDGRLALGRKAELEEARKRKEEMAAQIAEAEGASESDSDASERARNAAFEAAQTKHGTYAQYTGPSDSADMRPKTPPIITPLPTLDGVIERLRKQLSEMQSSRLQGLQEMEQLQREKIRLAEEEVRIQRALKETAEKFDELRREKGIPRAGSDATKAIEAQPLEIARDIGSVAEDGHDVEDSEEEQSVERPSHGGLGFSGDTGNAGTGMGFVRPATDHSDSDSSGSGA